MLKSVFIWICAIFFTHVSVLKLGSLQQRVFHNFHGVVKTQRFLKCEFFNSEFMYRSKEGKKAQIWL